MNVMQPITKTADLAAACGRLAAAEYVTVDTEFMRETTYWPKLCLIQMAGPDDAVLVDAMVADLDLTPFFKLMADESVLKVFHSGRQDIEIVFHRGNLIPHPVFDTQVAAMVCGFGDSISYDQLVARLSGAQIDKSSRFTDWARRPLTDRQLAYALADVTHLREVYRSIAEKLEALGRAHWVETEMEILTSPETYRMEPERAWTRLKMRARKPVELAALKALAAWREREAQSRDLPRSRVIKDDSLYEIASQIPTTPADLAALRTIGRGFERSKAGDQILTEMKAVAAIPRDQLPKLPRIARRGERNSAAIDLLKVLLKMVSENEGVASKVIATVDDLEAIADDDNAEVPALTGWRRALFGEAALRLKRGELALRVADGRVRIVPTGEARNAEAAE
jgi:ribonuclease D